MSSTSTSYGFGILKGDITQEFRRQLIEWRQFREYQDKQREYYVSRKSFPAYRDTIRESQADASCKWDL